MTLWVFLGPSLPLNDARTLCEARFSPPARRGDIVAAIRAGATAIGLIDGFFEQVPSVWHKEILWALSQGVPVTGAASMGALRAAELAQFGMIGIGRIFEAYQSGRFAPFEDRFEDDDEVAVVHAPQALGYAASDAMVDIRATLAAACTEGVINADQMHALAAIAKGMFYKTRTWRAVLSAAHDAGCPSDPLAAWLPENRISQKRLDAEALLRHDYAPVGSAFRFERTLLWESVVAGAYGAPDS